MTTKAPSDLRVRTKQFALRVIKLYQRLSKTGETKVISKMEGSLQELDETAYWLELLVDGNIVTPFRIHHSSFGVLWIFTI